MVPRGLRIRLRYSVRQLKGFVIHYLLHADDPPHELALGVAIGVWVTFTPTIGIQMALIVFLAWLLRANKVVGLPIAWITNPATIVPMYYPCYWLGRVILGHPDVGMEWWKKLAHPPTGWWPAVTFYLDCVWEIFEPLWLGCLIIATVLAVISYVIVLFTVRWYRMRRWGTLVPPRRSQ